MVMRRHHNPNKVPPFKPDPEHWTKKVHSWKAKVAYETEDDAWEFLKTHPKLIEQGMTVYRCNLCRLLQVYTRLRILKTLVLKVVAFLMIL